MEVHREVHREVHVDVDVDMAGAVGTEGLRTDLFSCPHCTRGFKRETAFDRHVAMCSFASRSVRKRKQDDKRSEIIPTMADMFSIVVELKAKQSQLERKVDELSKWVETKKRKLDVLDWLQQHRAVLPLSFPAWVATLEARVARSHLELIFEHDYIQGVGLIIKELLPPSVGDMSGEDERPITAFNVNHTLLYIYSADNTWEIMQDDMFSTLTVAIYRGVLEQFIQWQKENRWRIHQDDYTTMYATNVKKVMGGHMSRAYINGRIRRDLYHSMKVNVRAITEVELSF